MDILYKTVKVQDKIWTQFWKFNILPRSPDFNLIENVFNFVKSYVRTQPFEQNIN